MAQGTTRDFEAELEQIAPLLGAPESVELDGLQENVERLNALVGQWVNTLITVGGVVTIAARRVEYAPGMYETRAVVGKWDSYAPAERLEREKDAEELSSDEIEQHFPEGEPAPTGG